MAVLYLHSGPANAQRPKRNAQHLLCHDCRHIANFGSLAVPGRGSGMTPTAQGPACEKLAVTRTLDTPRLVGVDANPGAFRG
jgi:hypothetical protein